MDSLEARLRFITVLKTLQKTLNVINISEITSGNTTTNHTHQNDSSSVIISNDDGSISSNSTTATTTPSSSTLFTQTTDTKYINPIEFYLKNYKEHYEDFHQCLIDTMKKFNVLDRLPITIYYFKLIYLLYYDINNDISLKILNEFMIPSLIEILNLILPENDIISLTNLPLCEDLVECLVTSPRIGAIISEELILQLRQIIQIRTTFKQTILENYTTSQLITVESDQATIEPPTILNRMEMDRDRHKRSKETNWKVKRPGNGNTMLNVAEFKTQWNTVTNLTSNDLQDIATLDNIAKESYLL